jgi:hypothetical protein
VSPGAAVPIVRPAALYFLSVFGVGFALGATRALWVVPRTGERAAELVEAPIMIVVTILAARWVMRRRASGATPGQRLGIGAVALALLSVTEVAGVLWLRGMSLGDYVTRRDPVSGTVYFLSLALFGLMPLIAAPRRGTRPA